MVRDDYKEVQRERISPFGSLFSVLKCSEYITPLLLLTLQLVCRTSVIDVSIFLFMKRCCV